MEVFADGSSIIINERDSFSEVSRVSFHEDGVLVKVGVFIGTFQLCSQCDVVLPRRIQDQAKQ